MIALDADTGKLKWYFQFTPGDEYDWDATQVPVLVDMEWQGKPRKLMLWANRNGFFYVLDRVTGKFLMGKPFVKQTWSNGLDENGRPDQEPRVLAQADGRYRRVSRARRAAPTGIRRPTARARGFSMCRPGITTRRARRSIRPASGWRASGTRDPRRRPAWTCHGGGRQSRANPAFKKEDEGYGAIRALDPKTGEKKWDFKMVNYTESGVLSTAGDLVFGGGMEGNFVALDARTGERLWHVNLGGPNASGPISYAVDGKQYVVGTGQGTMYVFALPD